MGKIGESQISTKHLVSLPKAVVDFFELAIGDRLAWYPPEEDFTSATTELIAVRIVRASKR